MSNTTKGRLKQGFSPEALEVIKRDKLNADVAQELRNTIYIDAAHTLMISELSLMSTDITRQVMGCQLALLRDEGFDQLLNTPAPRGIYMAYEQYLIDKLGMEVGGAMHLGRSRNDINATLFKLALRERFVETCDKIIAMRQSLQTQIAEFHDTPFVVYSQFQPALPGTFAFYLAGIEQAYSRLYRQLAQLQPDIQSCPMGGCAGGGTDLAINMEITAKYLGFERPIHNALDAVASRDLALSMLSLCANIAVLTSRLAQDFQLWTMQETRLIDFPDALVGTSSMLPQKRNPYLLEKIKGKCSRVTAALQSAMATMLKTPFSNSVEIGTEGIMDVNKGITELNDAMTLMQLLVDNVTVDADNVKRASDLGVVNATGVANQLVQQGKCAFREAHHQVAGAITDAMTQGDNASEAVAALVADNSDTLQQAKAIRYGAGPGATASLQAGQQAQLTADQQQLNQWLEYWQQSQQTLLDALNQQITA